MLGLCCWASIPRELFSSCGEQGLLTSCGAVAPHWGGSSLRGLLLLGSLGSHCRGPHWGALTGGSSLGALTGGLSLGGPHWGAPLVGERRLSGTGSQELRLPGSVAPWQWDRPGPGIKPLSPALAGRFFTVWPPGKPMGNSNHSKF